MSTTRKTVMVNLHKIPDGEVCLEEMYAGFAIGQFKGEPGDPAAYVIDPTPSPDRRERIASALLAAQMTKHEPQALRVDEARIKTAVRLADALIAELDKTKATT
jgi:hypothetical protein